MTYETMASQLLKATWRGTPRRNGRRCGINTPADICISVVLLTRAFEFQKVSLFKEAEPTKAPSTLLQETIDQILS